MAGAHFPPSGPGEAALTSPRILIVDDEPAMHDSYRRALGRERRPEAGALDAMAAELWDDIDQEGSADPAAELNTMAKFRIQ